VLLADAATTVVQVVLIGGVVIFIALLMRWGLSGRAKAARVRRSPLFAEGDTTARPPGSAVEIEDAGQVPVRDLLGALRVHDSDDLVGLDVEELFDALGLKYFQGGGTRPLTGGATYPTVMYGERNGREVVIRQGLVGTATFPGLRMQKDRHVTAVRVQAPSFELAARDGRIDAPADAPGEVRGVVEAMNPSPDVWHDLRMVGGAEGMVASRGSVTDYLGGWIYDLWFLERLAAELDAPALPAVGVDEDWEIPYGMGDWAPKPWSR
jgi:hypothetical protein